MTTRVVGIPTVQRHRREDTTMALAADDLRRLIDSDLPDASLVLVEGRLDVVKADDLDLDPYRGALLVVSREELLARSGGLPVTDARLDQIAATVGSAVDNLGG